MALTARHERFEASRLVKFRRYFWYGIGEILLIFAGITLALWFGNWNDERQLREVELLTLAEIAADLESNVAELKENIAADTRLIASCRRFMDAVAARETWRNDLAIDLSSCRWWTTPFLSSAAYDSLKAKGTELISDLRLRNAIVSLYEQSYAYLVIDVDRSFMGFENSVMNPIFNQHVRNVETDRSFPNDYEALLDSNEFNNMLHTKVSLQEDSIRWLQLNLKETEKVIRLIKNRLSGEEPIKFDQAN